MAEPDDFKILLADEHIQTVDSLSLILENEGFETLKAFDKESTIQKAQKEKPDLIVMHWHIIEPNAKEIADALSDFKILFTDAIDGDESEAVKCSNTLGLLRKPINNDELIEAIKKALKI